MMHQTSPNSSQSPNKLMGNCFSCQKPGHWAKDCPNYRRSISSCVTSDPNNPPIQCQCGAGLCEIRVSASVNNPGRKYYRCPGKYSKYCGYFMWCDNLTKEPIPESQPKSFPICGCEAGVATLLTEGNGPNAGRRYFGCHIKKGEGACNFKQWVDDAPQSGPTDDTVSQQNNVLNELGSSDQATQIEALQKSSCELLLEDFNFQVQTEVHELPNLEGCEHMDGEDDEPSYEIQLTSGESTDFCPPPEISISENPLDSEISNQNDEILQMRMDDSPTKNVQPPVTPLVATLSNPHKQDSPFKYLMACLLEDLSQTGRIADPSAKVAISTVTSFFTRPLLSQYPFMLAGKITSIEGFSPGLDDQSRSQSLSNSTGFLKDTSDEGSIMAGTILYEFEKLAHRFQNELITLLESMDPHNYRIMLKEAECTFVALDCLQVDYAVFQAHVIEYITQAAALAQIEQLITHDASSQELLQRYKVERSQFDEICRAYCEAKAVYMASNERLNLLRENATCLKGMLNELEIEISCCETENSAHHDNLLHLTKTKLECENRLRVACQEVAEAMKLSEKREIERSAVKAAFEKAKALLRKSE